MAIKATSSYKTEADRDFVADWNSRVQQLNGSFFQPLTLPTAFGDTIVHSLNHDRPDLEPLLIIPGARTFGMYWDLNDNLRPLKDKYRLYLVDVIGQPGRSSGHSPSVKTAEFGDWLFEVLDGLGLAQTNIAGASFGGLLAMKLANLAPERITKMILLNPIGFSYISLAPVSLFYNLLPIISPTVANVRRFVDHIVLAGGEEVNAERQALLVEIILQTLKRFNFQADYPYKMADAELTHWKVPTYLIVGDSDGLIPHQKTVRRAKQCVRDLRGVEVLKNIGHGIELSHAAIDVVKRILAGIEPTHPPNR